MAAARSGFGVWRVGFRALGERAAEGGGKRRTAAPAVTTLAIYIAIGVAGAAFGQVRVTTTPEQFTSTATIGVAPPAHHGLNLIAPPSPVITAAVKPAPLPTPERVPDVVVIKYGPGGLVDEYKQRYADYRLTKTKVELRGPCYSACTLIFAYVAAENLCIAEGAFMAFHAIRSLERGVRMDRDTWLAYTSMPPEIRWWIDDNGGHENLPLKDYWTLYDRQMWAMGYPKCKPVGG